MGTPRDVFAQANCLSDGYDGTREHNQYLHNEYAKNLDFQLAESSESYIDTINQSLFDYGSGVTKMGWKPEEDTMKIFRMSLLDEDKNVPVSAQLVHTAIYNAMDKDHVLLEADVAVVLEKHNEKRGTLVNEFNVPLRPVTIDDLRISVSVVDELS